MAKKQTSATRKKSVNSELYFQSPAKIENSYRKIFGQHNLHFTLLAIIAQKFKDDNLSTSDFTDIMRELSKKYKHHRTYSNSTNFQAVYIYIIESHIAYCFSAGDHLCQEIRSSKPLKNLKSNDKDSIFTSIDTGDFINKTLALIFWNQSDTSKKLNPNQLLELAKEKIINSPEFSILNYYRNIRNQTLHSAKDHSIIDTLYESLNLTSIQEKYNKTPSKYPNLTSDDALVCALAWIDAARWLCRNIYNHEQQLLPEIKCRFNHLSSSRRHAAATNFMLQDLLFTQAETTATLEALSWHMPTQ